MSNEDYIMYDLSMLLTRSKNADWKQNVLLRSSKLFKFLKDNNLVDGIELFDEHGDIKKDTIIMKSNLTDEGDLIFEKAWQSWERYLDNGGDVNNIARLEKGLKKIREDKKKAR